MEEKEEKSGAGSAGGASNAVTVGAAPVLQLSTDAERAAYLGSLGFTEREVVTKLARSWRQADIAKVLAIDESLVSQIASKPENVAFVQSAGKAQSEQNEKFDKKLDDGEAAALDRVVARIPTVPFQQQLQAFKVLNSAKRRRDSVGAPLPEGPTTVVQLVLPEVIRTQYIRNAQSEIVEVEGRTMISARAADLPALLQARLGREPAKKEEVVTSDQVIRTERILSEPAENRRRRIPIKDLDISDIL